MPRFRVRLVLPYVVQLGELLAELESKPSVHLMTSWF
jgi:hypothetical protein